MALYLSSLSDRQALSAIYIGYYNRAADPVGMQFWEGVVNTSGLNLTEISTDFAGQDETKAEHPFFANPEGTSAGVFITTLYQNLFNRDPDAAGLNFWTGVLEAAMRGDEGSLEVGEIITSIIEGATNVPGGTQDKTVILNKINVAVHWTDAAEAAGLVDYENDQAAQDSAHSVIDGITEDPSTVTNANINTDAFFTDGSGVPGEVFRLTSGSDDISGTAGDDLFNGRIGQNESSGGTSNTLSTADVLDGKGGYDRLHAQLMPEFVGSTSNGITSDVQPDLTNIQKIDIEAMDLGMSGGGVTNDAIDITTTAEFNPFIPTATLDAKDITDHEEIGSYYSDGDLAIENLTTLTHNGTARNTSDITVTMDHTDNFNSDGDASDLYVLFDNNYLLSGQDKESEAYFWLLDEDADLAGLDNRLEKIDADGLHFSIENEDGSVTDVILKADEANTAGTHQGFVNALQPALQALIADGILPAGTMLTLDPTNTTTTFVDDGSESRPIPAMVVTIGDGSPVTAIGFSRIEEIIGEYDVYGRVDQSNEVTKQPVSIDIDLHKVGRGGEGGDLVVGAKSTNSTEDPNGIEVFNITVEGGSDKPSNLGTITSTGTALSTVNIVSAPTTGDGYASLTVRNGFDQNLDENIESGDLELINADGFLGNLTLGDIDAAHNAGRITNADTITAQGGGNVTLGLLYDGEETGQAYSVTTGGGNDDIDIALAGDALDYAGSSLNVSTGDGDDRVNVELDLNRDIWWNDSNQQLNQAILDNVTIDTGAGDDFIVVSGLGNVNIDAGSGDDVIITAGIGAEFNSQEYVWEEVDNAKWAFNFDDNRPFDITNDGELPGVQPSLAYLSGAEITVTLSGAGGGAASGGGVMANGLAIAGQNGFESTVTIGSLINGNQHFGDQRDVNAAIIRAINDDPILGNLLEAYMGSNNTLVVKSLTSGEFDAEDLRIDIAQNDGNWSSVQSEARALFQDSSLSVSSVADANTVTGKDLTTSANSDAWYDGLSVAGDANSADNNQANAGAASVQETDNVINGGAGDDLIVLSTDATAAPWTLPYTPGGNNSMFEGSSNETVVMTGSNFGNDTIMNFTTGGFGTKPDDVEAPQTVMTLKTIQDGTAVVPATLETFTLDLTNVPAAGSGYNLGSTLLFPIILVGPNETGLDIANKPALQIGAPTPGDYDIIGNANGIITFRAKAGNEGVDLPDVGPGSFTAPPVFTDNAIVTNTDGAPAVPATPFQFSATFEDAVHTDVDNTIDIHGVTVNVAAGETGADIAANVAAAFAGNADYTPVYSAGSDTVTFTANNPGPGGLPSFDGVISGMVDGGPALPVAGVDFLDFTEYLTSLEDVSGLGGSSDSHQLIDIRIETNTSDVDANEVVYDMLTTGSWNDLSASDIEALFEDTSDYGNLSAANYHANHNIALDDVVGGAAKAIIAIENGDNLGEYKIFELSWDSSLVHHNSAEYDAALKVNELGSLDFGTTLNGFTDLNLVGSEAYQNAVDNGFLM